MGNLEEKKNLFLLPDYVNDLLNHVVLVATCRTQKSHGLRIDMHYVIVLKGNHQLNRKMKQQNIKSHFLRILRIERHSSR